MQKTDFTIRFCFYDKLNDMLLTWIRKLSSCLWYIQNMLKFVYVSVSKIGVDMIC